MKKLIFSLSLLALFSCNKQEDKTSRSTYRVATDYHNVSIDTAIAKIRAYQSSVPDTTISSFGIEASTLRARLSDPRVVNVRFYIGQAIDRVGITLYSSYETAEGKSIGVDEYYCPCPTPRDCCKSINEPVAL